MGYDEYNLDESDKNNLFVISCVEWGLGSVLEITKQLKNGKYLELVDLRNMFQIKDKVMRKRK